MKSKSLWESYSNRINLLFHALVASTMIPFAWAFLETQRGFSEAPLLSGDLAKGLMIAFGILSIGLIFGAQYFKRRFFTPIIGDNLEERLAYYLSQNLKHYAIIEGVAILGMVGLLLTKNQFFSMVYLIALFIFSQVRPTYDRMVREMSLTKEEEKAIREELNPSK